MSGAVKSWWISTKVPPVVALSQWNWWSTCYIVFHLLNMCGDTMSTSFGNSLPKQGISARASIFFMLQCLFDQPLCKTLKQFNRIWFFLRSGLP